MIKRECYKKKKVALWFICLLSIGWCCWSIHTTVLGPTLLQKEIQWTCTAHSLPATPLFVQLREVQLEKSERTEGPPDKFWASLFLCPSRVIGASVEWREQIVPCAPALLLLLWPWWNHFRANWTNWFGLRYWFIALILFCQLGFFPFPIPPPFCCWQVGQSCEGRLIVVPGSAS